MIWIERFDVERSFASHISSLLLSAHRFRLWFDFMPCLSGIREKPDGLVLIKRVKNLKSLCNKQADSFLTNWTIIVFSPTGTNAQLDGELSLIYTIHFSFAKETYSDTKYTQLSKTASQHQSRFEHYLSDKLIKRRVKYFILDQQKLNKS